MKKAKAIVRSSAAFAPVTRGYIKLLQAAVVIPAVDGWGPFSLGLGTTVLLDLPDLRHCYAPGLALSNIHSLHIDDLRIIYRDVAGRLVPGWINRHIPTTTAGHGSPMTVPWIPDAKQPLMHLDILRGRARMANQTLMAYISTHGEKPPILTELQGVIRELGGRMKDADDPITVIRRALRLILSREVPMAEVQEARETAKKSTSKKAGRKAADREVERAVEREPSARGGTAIGETLVKLGVGGKAAKRLAKGETLKKKELQALRDEINAAAVEARENNKGKLASQLSAANRTIRRMARAA